MFSLSWQLIRFLSVGTINTLVGLLVIFGTKAFLYDNDVVANGMGYCIGLSVSFLLNKRWTFRDNSPIITAGLRFLTVFVIAYSVNLGVVLGCIHWLNVNSYLAQALGIPPYTITFYLLCKYYSFTTSEFSASEGKG